MDLYYRLAGLNRLSYRLCACGRWILNHLYYLLKRTHPAVAKTMPGRNYIIAMFTGLHLSRDNVRELQNEIQRLVVLNTKAVLSAEF